MSICQDVFRVVLSWMSWFILTCMGWHPTNISINSKSMLIASVNEGWNIWVYLVYLYVEGTPGTIVVDDVKWWMKLLPFVSLSPICKIQNQYMLFKDKIVLIPFTSFQSCVDCCLQYTHDNMLSVGCVKLNNNPCRRELDVQYVDTPSTEEQVYLAIDKFMSPKHSETDESFYNPLSVSSCVLLIPLLYGVFVGGVSFDLKLISCISWIIAFNFHYHYELEEKSYKQYYTWFEYLVMYIVVRWFISSISWSMFWAKIGCLFIMFQLSIHGGSRHTHYYRPYMYSSCCLYKYILMVAVALA